MAKKKAAKKKAVKKAVKKKAVKKKRTAATKRRPKSDKVGKVRKKRAPRKARRRRTGGLVLGVGTSTIGFTKAPASPIFVRITINGNDVALMPGAMTGQSHLLYPVGATVTAFVEVTGNPGDVAVVAVERALPSQIQLGVGGKSQNNGARRLRVTG